MSYISLYDDDGIQDSRYLVTHICGSDEDPHTQIVYLSSLTSAAAKEETLKELRRSWCPACHRQQRQLNIRQRSNSFGLAPLKGSDLRQLELADEIRVRLLQVFIASQVNPQAIKVVVSLINRCVEANFWIEHRVILWDSLHINDTLEDLRAR